MGDVMMLTVVAVLAESQPPAAPARVDEEHPGD
jgi:hypothetical protein